MEMNEEAATIFDNVFKLKQGDIIKCKIFHHKWDELDLIVHKRIMSEIKDKDKNSMFELSYSCSLNGDNSEILNFKEEHLV